MDAVRIADPRERARAIGHAIGVPLLAFLVANILGTLGITLLAGVGVTEGTAPVMLYTTLYAVNFLGFLLVGLGYLDLTEDRALLSVRRPTLRDVAWVVVGLLALYAVLVVLSWLYARYGVQTTENSAITRGRENPTLFLVLVLTSLLLTAPAEELLFRGIVQGLFRRAYGSAPAVIAASAVFGLAHYLALIGSDGSVTASIALVVALGVVLAIVYELSENLLVPVAIHGIWNAYQFAAAYLRAVDAMPGLV